VIVAHHSAQIAGPALSTPRPREASYGVVAGHVGRRAQKIVIRVGKRIVLVRPALHSRFRFSVPLPLREVTVRVSAVDADGHVATTVVSPVLGLPGKAAPRAAGSYQDGRLSNRVVTLARRFPGTSGTYVQDLQTGAGAAWNARARFPAASTLKLAIAVEVLRSLRHPPAPGSEVALLMDAMLDHSDNRAANALLVYLGGSESAGASRVDGMLRTVGLNDTEMFGGYLVGTKALHRRPIPVRVDSSPGSSGKYTTAFDLARLLRDAYLASGGTGPLEARFGGTFTPDCARYLLYEIAHAQEPGRLGRYLPRGVVLAHKAGWISDARHDNGLVFWRGGVFVATVMTWQPSGAGWPSDELAGRIARTALNLFSSQTRMRRRNPRGWATRISDQNPIAAQLFTTAIGIDARKTSGTKNSSR
jgi:beta-lactamase class A